MTLRPTVLTTAALTVVAALALTGCGSPGGGSAARPAAFPAVGVAAQRTAKVAATTCKDGANQVASIAPGKITTDPGTITDSPTLRRIRKNKHLTVGTSGDVLLWGATDPKTGALEGFDIDVLAQVATALGYAPASTAYKVVNYAQRLTSLADNSVDLVAHTMTINCARWQGSDGQPNPINFSSEYYRAGQRVLVRSDSSVTRIEQLKGQKVCVPAASTNQVNVKGMGLQLVPLNVIGDCLVQFQEGEVAAITGDDTVLAGFAAQDPYAKVVGDAFSEEPYGLGINADDPQFTQFVNAVLEKMRRDGSLARLYDKWMANAVTGPRPAIPQPVYGRRLDALQRTSR